jgi:hypothetical protein
VEGEPDNPGYAAFHQPRFTFLLELARERMPPAGGRLLDIGRSPLTSLLAGRLKTTVDSLGLEADAPLPNGHHHQFDLNDAADPPRWRRGLGPYDVIVFAEVLEHLYTAPGLVLRYLRELLTADGCIIVQTPNAAALGKRVKLLIGRNPFERIRVDRSNPGHFREYTLAEMKELVAEAGLVVEASWMKYYFDARYAHHETGREPPARVRGALKNVLYRLLPPLLREGMTLVARRQPA